MSPQECSSYHREVALRLEELDRRWRAGAFDEAIELMAETIHKGGVVQAFGTGHSEAFAMEIAGRAGGLIPTNRIALRDPVLAGSRPVSDLSGEPPLERDPAIAADVLATVLLDPRDSFIIASSSGVNGATVGLALLAKERGHKVIAVTSLQHTARVQPKHPCGKRLSEIADIVIDNLAPYGDAVLKGEVPMGAVSSITSAYIAQLLTVGVAERFRDAGLPVPLYLSANIPGGDDHNRNLEAPYGARIRRVA